MAFHFLFEAKIIRDSNFLVNATGAVPFSFLREGYSYLWIYAGNHHTNTRNNVGTQLLNFSQRKIIDNQRPLSTQ